MNIFPNRLVDSVNDMVGKVKIRVLRAVGFNASTPHLMEFKDQDGELLDSTEIGIPNVENLREELDERVSKGGNENDTGQSLRDDIDLKLPHGGNTTDTGQTLRDDIDKKLEEEEDPTVPQHVKDITPENIADWGADEEDPTVPSHVKGITESDIERWDTEEDPTVPQHVKNISEDDILNWNAAEEDPTVPDHVKSITTEEKGNWNNASEHADSPHAPSDAQKNVQSDWDAVDGDAYIKNKPDLSVEDTNNNTEKHKIAQIGGVNGNPINETVTKLLTPVMEGNTLVIKYLNENGVIQDDATVDLSELVTNEIHLSEETYLDTSQNKLYLKRVDEDGTALPDIIIDFSEFSIESNTDAEGVTQLVQEEVVKLIVSKVGQTGHYDDLIGAPEEMPPSAHTLGSHSDVTITNATSGQLIKWDGSKWANVSLKKSDIIDFEHGHDATEINEDASHRFVTDAEKQIWNNKASTDTATLTSDGLMSKDDKLKLNGLEEHPDTHPASMITQDLNHRFVTDDEKAAWNTAEKNVQSDWTATTGDSFIRNKPTKLSDFNNDLPDAPTHYVRNDVADTKNGNLTLNDDLEVKGLSNQAGVYNDSYGVFSAPIIKAGKRGFNGSTDAGAIKITLPKLWSNTMMTFTVKIFQYNSRGSSELLLSGYNYTGGNWVNASAANISSSDNANYSVRFGHDGNNACIWLGELDTFSRYTTVIISDFFASVGGNKDWAENWNISLVTSFDTVQVTKTNNFIWGDWDKLKGKTASDNQLLLGDGSGKDAGDFATNGHEHDEDYEHTYTYIRGDWGVLSIEFEEEWNSENSIHISNIGQYDVVDIILNSRSASDGDDVYQLSSGTVQVGAAKKFRSGDKTIITVSVPVGWSTLAVRLQTRHSNRSKPVTLGINTDTSSFTEILTATHHQTWTSGNLTPNDYLKRDGSNNFTGTLIFDNAFNSGAVTGSKSQRLLLGGGTTWSSASGAYINIEGIDYGGIGAGGNIRLTPTTGKEAYVWSNKIFHEGNLDPVTRDTSQTITGNKTHEGALILRNGSTPVLRFHNGTDSRWLYRGGDRLMWEYKTDNNYVEIFHEGNLAPGDYLLKNGTEPMTGQLDANEGIYIPRDKTLKIGTGVHTLLEERTDGKLHIEGHNGIKFYTYDGNNSIVRTPLELHYTHSTFEGDLYADSFKLPSGQNDNILLDGGGVKAIDDFVIAGTINDLDDRTLKPGIYKFSLSSANNPVGSSGMLEVGHTGASSYYTQKAHFINAVGSVVRMMIRHYSGNTGQWGEWMELWHSGNLTPNDYLKKTGKIGGRNYFFNSGNFSSSEGWSKGIVEIVDGFSVLRMSPGAVYVSDAPRLESDTTYVLSAELMSSADFDSNEISSGTPLHNQAHFNGSNSGARKNQWVIDKPSGVIPANTWFKISIGIETVSGLDDTAYLRAYIYSTSLVDNVYWVKNIKLEKSDIASDWSPNPDDYLKRDGSLPMTGDLDIGNNILTFNYVSSNNIDHIWHAEGGNEFHFVSDTARKAVGNSILVGGGFKTTSGQNNNILLDGGGVKALSNIWHNENLQFGTGNTDMARGNHKHSKLYGHISVTEENWNDIYDDDSIYKLDVYNIPGSVTGMHSVHGTVLGISGRLSHDKTQLIFNGSNGNIQYRKSWYPDTPWTALRTIWDSENLTQLSQLSNDETDFATVTYVGEEIEAIELTPGPKGDKGDKPAHSWSGYSLRFQNPDGTWGTYTNLRGQAGADGNDGDDGADFNYNWSGTSLGVKNSNESTYSYVNLKGSTGDKGDKPNHSWSGTSLRFETPSGAWGSYVNLKGPKGDPGDDGSDATVTKAAVEDALTGTITSHNHDFINVQDVRSMSGSDGGANFMPLPENIPDRTVSAYFGYAGLADSWQGILTVKGWAGNYASWQMAGNATSSSSINDEFRVRTGHGTTWNDWYELWHSGNLKFGNGENDMAKGNHGHDWDEITGKPSFAPSNAEANVQSDWNATSGDAFIKNKPSIPTQPSDIGAAPASHNHDDNYVMHTRIWADRDLNALTAPGMYRLHTPAMNFNEFPNAAYGNMISISGGADTVTQIGCPYTHDELYFRRGTNANIGSNPWKRLWHEGNFNPSGDIAGKVNRSGDTMNGTLAIETSGYGNQLKLKRTDTSVTGIEYTSSNGAAGVFYAGFNCLDGVFGLTEGVVNFSSAPIMMNVRTGVVTAEDFKGTLNTGSDITLKEDIEKLKPTRIDSTYHSYVYKKDKRKIKHTGVIANELEKKHPEFVNKDDKGIRSVNYIDLYAAEIAFLKHENDETRKENEELRREMKELKEMVTKLIK